MIERKTRRKNAGNQTKMLLGLIGILVVLLVVAVSVAISIGSEEAVPTPGSTEQSQPPKDSAAPMGLIIESPQVQEFVCLDKTLVFTGTSDPAESFTINGSEISRNADGSFSQEVPLKLGINEITLVHKGQTVAYKVEHRYAVESFYPEKDTEYNSGETVKLEITVRKGSTVKARLGDKDIPMQKQEDKNADFQLYVGTYKLPADNTKDLDMGKVTFTVTCEGQEEVYTSGTITCKKSADVVTQDPAVTPDYGRYLDVGSGYIVKIVTYSAETFDGRTRDDYSDPRNNYLPEGTVDYGMGDIVYDNSGKMKYRLLRCGYRVYTERKNYPDPSGKIKMLPVVECYKGTLPDHNEIGFASLGVSGSHTVLTLDTMWKAPFYFDLLPQTYNDPGARDFKVSALTAEYVDITFCYATKFTGSVEIPGDNPLFKSAKLTQNESDCTLRLYLKEKGGFYGWDSYYNDKDQLCFQFLNPTPATAKDNAYGADLTGIRVMIDVGHGGIDGGSPATTADGKTVEEADINLDLAKRLEEQLKSMGATVILNRTDDSNLTVDQRIQFLKEQSPDLCVAIHHNSYKPLASVSGCDVMYFSPGSQKAANEIYKQIQGSGVYKKTMLKWNVYYVARETVCPVVLAECGYMTNPEDLAGALDPNVVQQKAQDIARGVANYFLTLG